MSKLQKTAITLTTIGLAVKVVNRNKDVRNELKKLKIARLLL